MQLEEKFTKRTGKPYFLITYETEDIGFYLLRDGNGTFYPAAIMVVPREPSWVARINWADWSKADDEMVFSETFKVNGKMMVSLDPAVDVSPTHNAVWIHCIGLINQHEMAKKEVEKKKGDKIAAENSVLVTVPPVWQAWHKPTISEMDSWGKELL